MENFATSLCQVKEDIASKVKDIKIEDFKGAALIDKCVKIFAMKAKCVKAFNIISNVALSSYLLVIVLPDV